MKILLSAVYSVFSCFVIQNYCHAQEIDQSKLLAFYENQQYAEAANYMLSHYGDSVQDKRMLASIANNFRMAGQVNKAEVYYHKLYTLDSTHRGALSNLGAFSYQKGNLQKAKFFYTKLLEVDSVHVQSLVVLADLAKTEAKLDDALKYLRHANAIAPDRSDIVYDLASLYIVLEANLDAEELLAKSLENDPENILLMKLQLEVLYAQKKYTEVVQLGERLEEIGDRSDLLYGIMAPSYYFLKKYDKGIETYDKLEESGDLKEGSLYYKAMCYKALKRNEEAIAYLDKTLEAAVSENTSSYYTIKAQVYEDMNWNKNALAAYQKSLQFKEEPLTFYSLALLYDLRFKQVNNASKYYNTYLKVEKDLKGNKDYIDYVTERLKQLNAGTAKK
ncbi:tetratricopeptide repeat protein [Olivibacter sitiensis]|uniref:tetratricopeptide repeat protein n=1 Tax=Olivibacter sitiensis TaxID=376470 RepID=UPI00040BCD7D|nr:tetratricopeptide repeat protein [Olivibacter sitiensis]